MVYTESYVSTNKIYSILENVDYIDSYELESYVSPKTIPILENSRFNSGVILYSDLEKLSSVYGISIGEAAIIVAESHNIDPNNISIGIDDYRIIENPNIIQEQDLFNVVAIPISPNSIEYQYVDYLVESFLETGDSRYLDYIFNENDLDANISDQFSLRMDNLYRDKNKLHNNEQSRALNNYIVSKMTSDSAKKIIDRGRGIVNFQRDLFSKIHTNAPKAQNATLKMLDRIDNELEHIPRTKLAKFVASLRLKYQNWLLKNEFALNSGNAGILKTIATYFVKLIDKGMMLLQRGANHIGTQDYRNAFNY